MTATATAPPQALQTFEIRPTPAALLPGQTVDELMIDWSGLPAGSTASIFLPAVSADEVLAMAAGMYVTHRFSRVDAHTLACDAGGVSYLPVPKGFAQNYAGLLTVTLPAAARSAQGYSVIVRQITTGYREAEQANAVAGKRTLWRQVLGTFQVALAIKPPAEALLATERLYAVFSWIAEAVAPSSRWYPVMIRYLAQLGEVITGLGGNPGQIKPSPTGQVPGLPGRPAGPDQDGHEVIGKVEGIIYDHFGDFDGFILETETGQRLRFSSREGPMLGLIRLAWAERTRVAVHPEAEHRRVPRSVILLAGGTPRHDLRER
jgi:hypothetical protein